MPQELLTPVNKILPYSVVDGPGNRAAVFLQGCNIHCLYCHNPETQQICCNCGQCVSECPANALTVSNSEVNWNEDLCCGCDTCIKTCPHHASPKVKWMTVEQVLEEIKKSIPFIRGVTVSGGECSLYPIFLEALFTKVKELNLTCLMDSNGMNDLSLYPELMKVCDGVMLDIKSWDNMVYQSLTGSTNDTVKKNLLYLADTGKLSELRIVTVPGYVDAKACVEGISELLDQDLLGDILLKLIRFRHFGVRGVLENQASPDMTYMEELREYALERGFRNIQIL